MNNKSAFLGDKGLSSSKANHIANQVNEKVKAAQRRLKQMFPAQIDAKVDDSWQEFRSRNFDKNTAADLFSVAGKYHPLNSWLRIAIKTKDRMLADLEGNHREREFPQPQPEQPYQQPMVGEDWFLQQLNVREMHDYLSYEARAAAIGKAIHNEGLLTQWQEVFAQDKISRWSIGGERTLVRVQADPEVASDVDELYFAMQGEHRLVNKRVNYWKAKMHDAVSEENQKRRRSNAQVWDQYQKQLDAWHVRRKAWVEAAEEAFEAERQSISRLKIVVPNELQSLVDELDVDGADSQKA